MPRKMSLAREIRTQKKQNKNRMVGQTFNPSGITDREISEREKVFIQEMKEKTIEERKEYWNNIKEILVFQKKNNWHLSWEWEWCSFKRYFVFKDEVI